MAGRSGTIDLGLLPPEPPDADASPPDGAQAWHWARTRSWHWWPAAVLAALLVLLTGPPPEPLEPPLVPLFAVPAGGQLAIAGDALYVVDTTAGARHPTLTAYELDGGTRRWARPLPGEALSVGLRQAGGVPLTTSGRTTAYDPATGELRWRRDSELVGVWPDGRVLLARVLSADGPYLLIGRFVVDPATGETGWAVPPGQYPLLPQPDRGRLVTKDENGRVVAYDADTGTQLAAMPPRAETSLGMSVVAGPVMVTESVTGLDTGDHARELTAYDTSTLVPRWRVDVPPGQPLVSGLASCRTVVCVREPDGVSGRDPRTGAVRWTLEWLPRPDAVGLQEPGPPWPAGYLLVDNELELRWQWILDAATGEPVVELADDGWRLSGQGGAQPEPVLTHPDPTTGRTWIARLDRDGAPRLRLLGPVDGPARDCTVGDGHLACRTGDAGARVWRLR